MTLLLLLGSGPAGPPTTLPPTDVVVVAQTAQVALALRTPGVDLDHARQVVFAARDRSSIVATRTTGAVLEPTGLEVPDAVTDVTVAAHTALATLSDHTTAVQLGRSTQVAVTVRSTSAVLAVRTAEPVLETNEAGVLVHG